MENFDRLAQEDAVMLTWTTPGVARFTGASSNMSFLAQPDAGYVLSVRVDQAPSGSVMLSTTGKDGALGSVDISDKLRGLKIGEWGEISVPLKCISSDATKWTTIISPLSISSDTPLKLGLSGIVIKGLPEPDQVCTQ